MLEDNDHITHILAGARLPAGSGPWQWALHWALQWAQPEPSLCYHCVSSAHVMKFRLCVWTNWTTRQAVSPLVADGVCCVSSDGVRREDMSEHFKK